jgi:glycosyltransferase involved in cell wall biosynthesis
MLAILSTHPIQYQVPLWQALAKDGRVPFEVWYLSDHGTRPSFDAQFKQSFSWDLDTLGGYPSRFLKTNRNHDVSSFSKLRLGEPLGDLLREKNVEALWIQGWQVAAYWQAVWQAHAAGIPVWLRGETNDLSQTPFWKSSIKRVALGQLFSRVKHFLYIGSANRRFYESYGVRPEQLHSAPYCVDNQRFAQTAAELRSERDEIRRAWGIPDHSFCVLFAGKFIPKKRPMDLVKAASLPTASAKARQIHLLFAGSGELGGELRNACRVVYDAEASQPSTNGNRSAVNGEATGKPGAGKPAASFTGFLNQTEISRAYVAADCLVLPSDAGETWGLVVNEAMASSLPCAASDHCGCSQDLVAPIKSELCFPLGDLDAIRAALLTVSQKRIEPERLRAQVDKFDVPVSVETVARLYHESEILKARMKKTGETLETGNIEAVGRTAETDEARETVELARG